jgi:hypothetical protein
MNSTAPRIRTFGFRVDRGGSVYVSTAPRTGGRTSPMSELYVGEVYRVVGGWRNDSSSDVHPNQTAAAERLIAITCG